MSEPLLPQQPPPPRILVRILLTVTDELIVSSEGKLKVIPVIRRHDENPVAYAEFDPEELEKLLQASPTEQFIRHVLAIGHAMGGYNP